MANTYQGKYKVKNRDKYNGNADDVVYRSGWEKQVMIFLDEKHCCREVEQRGTSRSDTSMTSIKDTTHTTLISG